MPQYLGPVAPPAPRKRRVWVVDDSKLEAEMARRALAGDLDVETFLDSSAALEHLTSREAPDALVLDWVMPGLSGIEFCEFLRRRPQTTKLPVLLLTTNQQTAQIVEGLSAGANDYLAKPYAEAELRARVAALLRSKELLERAEHAETLLRMVLAQLPDAVVTIDGRGVIIFANAQVEKVSGKEPGAIAGCDLESVFPGLLFDARAAPQGRQATLADFQIDGRIYAPRISIPPSDDQGNTTITLRDVTDIREHDASQVGFYSMVAHDLRSPLSALQGRAQLLLRGHRGEIAAPVKDDLTRMVARIRDLVQIVNDFLDIEHMESARFRLERRDVDVARMCHDLCDEYEPVAAERGVGLRVDRAVSARVLGDERRLSQALGNLVSNALKFTPTGGKVSIAATRSDGAVEVSVTDTGAGISPEAQAHLFVKYERGAGNAAARIEGTGLGLAIVKEIVEAHGGSVGARSVLSQGSTFWLRLPEVPAAA